MFQMVGALVSMSVVGPTVILFVVFLCSGVGSPLILITKTRLFKYVEISPPKNENFQIKKSDIFLIFAQKIDCGYSLEPPQ